MRNSIRSPIERGILFAAPMVRALLDGSKTQTRRALKVRCQEIGERDDGSPWPWSEHPDTAADHWHACPYGQAGDRLWVRETFAHIDDEGDKFDGMGTQTYYRASCPDPEGDTAWLRERGLTWTPSIHMPRWASRILLEITSVRVERLQDISDANAQAEGASPLRKYANEGQGPYLSGFCNLWKAINGPGSWDANPWVWVVEFKRVTP